MVLKRQPALTVPEVVRSYDRQVARLTREAHELRQASLKMERELEDAHAAAGAGPALRDEVERLRAREERAVAALTETLRLRDLLIVADRNLGQLRGEVARLNDQLAGYDDLARNYEDILHSTTWRLAWKVMGPYRRARLRIGR
jgi:uncharacterized protein involved in exopolysaccharide biosynthesis